MAPSTSVQAVRPCSKDRWSGWTFGTHLCAGTDPLRIKVTHEPDTCHLGLRLPAGAFLHGVDFCIPTLPRGAVPRSLRGGELELGRRHSNLETLSPLRCSRCVPVTGDSWGKPRPSFLRLLALSLFVGEYDPRPASFWLLVNRRGLVGSWVSSVPLRAQCGIFLSLPRI